MWIPVKRSRVNHYVDVPLYYQGERGMVVYKPAGKRIPEARTQTYTIPQLYIRESDRYAAILESQRELRRSFEEYVDSGDGALARAVLVEMVEEVLSDPKGGTILTLPAVTETVVTRLAMQPSVLKEIIRLGRKDYGTTVHSINVMALTLNYCFHRGVDLDDSKRFALNALLHDIGKTEISDRILTASRRLTDSEFQEMQRHPSIGAAILQQEGDDCIEAVLGALHHHERLDGTGYPAGLKDEKISEYGQIIGIVDCYEALTDDSRTYRSAMKPIEALELIKSDTDEGKYNRTHFESFAKSLPGLYE